MKVREQFKWLLIMSIMMCVLGFFIRRSESQLKRDPDTAQATQSINPLTPAVDLTGKVIDNTVNQVLPFDVSTESQLVKHENDCYRTCEKETDVSLGQSGSGAERGFAWTRYYECKERCPFEAAQKTESSRKAPAGSAIENIKSR